MTEPRTSFDARADRGVEAVDLGLDPPLDVQGRRHALHDRRRVSLRWLSATILTGLSGAWLMGIALIGAHDHEADFGDRPQLAQAPRPAGPADRQLVIGRKGDKLIRSVDSVTAKQTFRTPTTIRHSDREVIVVKSFARVATPLLLIGGAYQDDIPPFNPLKLLTEGGQERGAEPPLSPAREEPDADVSLVSREIGGAGMNFSAMALSKEDVLAQVREASAAPRQRAVALPPQLLLARTMRPPVEAAGALAYAAINGTSFSGLEVRMVPENVTVVPKTDSAALPDAPDERIATLKRGESFEALLRGNGATPAQARAVLAALAAALKLRPVQEGQRVKLLFGSLEGPGSPRQLVRVTLYDETTVAAIAAADDKGNFLSVARPDDENATARPADDDDDEDTSLQLYASLYETALKNDVPKALVEDLVRIFSSDSDTDFQRRVTGGDAVEMFYTDDEDGEGRQILFASLTAAGETKRYYRFVHPDDNSVDYFDENGRSAKKFLMRKPIVEGTISSGFGYRHHPVLGYSKMHTGVDWKNRVGTPIIAAGNGTVIKASWDTGYGRRVEIQHANGYVTTYNHMSAFARNIQPGVRVRQGQVIGYLGSSGLSTGPHLHYEVIVNDNYVNPMSIKLPRGRELDGRALAEFRRERERIDGLVRKAPTQTRVGLLSPR